VRKESYIYERGEYSAEKEEGEQKERKESAHARFFL